ncbi:MAG: FIST C-terminal domain-containing protein [Nitrospiraceae bacterium]|nr:FIST C-terminal domain-containing protein [Nitrospira sp.]MCB9774376.1 FIST C-terminal domain-containing protein [Nitrospiraceae bacterium]
MMQCHVALSQEAHPEAAAQAVAVSVYEALGQAECHLAFVFFSPHYSSDIQRMVDIIHENLRPQVLVGCMGQGVIGGDQEIEEHPGLVLWGLRTTNLRVVPFKLTPDTEGEEASLDGWPVALEDITHPYTFFLFADPFSTPIDELLFQLEEHAPGSSAIGGIASGGMDVGESRLVLNRDIIGSGVVGVAVQGGLEIRTVVSQGCQPIGERYVVTKVDRNIIQELGGIPPLERLETTLKALDEHEQQQVAHGLQVGIAMDEHRPEFGQGDFLIRGLLGADRESGSLAIADFVQEGQTIQFHVRDAHAASEDFHLLLSKERMTHPDSLPKGALLFSCNGRGRRFFETPHHDVSTLQQQMGTMPIAGFFAGGEIGPVSGKNFLHGYTASMALFYDEVSRPSKTGMASDTFHISKERGS